LGGARARDYDGMLRESIAANKFVTFFCSILDGNTRTFRYYNAGTADLR
jgi:hypothetical protein